MGMWGVLAWRWLRARSPSERKVQFLECVCVVRCLTCCMYKGRLMAYVRVPCGSLRSTLGWMLGRLCAVDGRARLREPRSSRLGKLFLLRQCQGSVAVLTSNIGPLLIWSHFYVATVQRWFGSIKQFPSISLLLCVLAPSAPVGVSGRGGPTAEIAFGNHPGITQHDVAIHNRFARTSYMAAHWYLICVSLVKFLCFVFHRS